MNEDTCFFYSRQVVMNNARYDTMAQLVVIANVGIQADNCECCMPVTYPLNIASNVNPPISNISVIVAVLDRDDDSFVVAPPRDKAYNDGGI